VKRNDSLNWRRLACWEALQCKRRVIRQAVPPVARCEHGEYRGVCEERRGTEFTSAANGAGDGDGGGGGGGEGDSGGKGGGVGGGGASANSSRAGRVCTCAATPFSSGAPVSSASATASASARPSELPHQEPREQQVSVTSDGGERPTV
jgi:hypothetical protein